MRLRPKYTRAKEEGRQGSGSLISTFLMRCCRQRDLVSAASGDELFRVLKTLLENINGFLHQPLALIAEHVILVHKFLQQGTSLLLQVCTSDDLLPQQVALGPEPLIPSLRFRMTPVACSNEAFMSSCNLAQPEI